MAAASCRPIHRLFAHAWYAGLVLSALSLVLLNQDFAPALVLMALLPFVFLCRGKTGILLAGSTSAVIAAIGFMVAGQQDLAPWLRSEALTMMMLAPMMAFAVLVPAIMQMEWKKMPEACLNQIDQSSIRSMSDSTSRETVGKVTPVTNRSRAA